MLIRPRFLANVVAPFPLLDVREYNLMETILIGLLVALGVTFISWLLAGYYERRGGFGKK